MVGILGGAFAGAVVFDQMVESRGGWSAALFVCASGYMSRHGHKLEFDNSNHAICPESNYRYEKVEEMVRCLDLEENKPLPDKLSVGSKSYDDFKETK